MGFTTGFLGGFTLTCATLYFSAAIHTRNRAQQSILLRQQAQVLKGLIEPIPLAPEPIARELPMGLTEMAKDKWNKELEVVVRRVYETDWRRVREGLEDKVGNVIEKIRDGGK
jgi:altered-inheritance-of-mitochondria protein 5